MKASFCMFMKAREHEMNNAELATLESIAPELIKDHIYDKYRRHETFKFTTIK